MTGAVLVLVRRKRVFFIFGFGIVDADQSRHDFINVVGKQM